MIVAPWPQSDVISRLRAFSGNPRHTPGLNSYYYLLWRISGKPGEENPEHELILAQLDLPMSKGEITCQKEILAFRRFLFRTLWCLADRRHTLFRELRWLCEHPDDPFYRDKVGRLILCELIRLGLLEEASGTFSRHTYLCAPVVDAMNNVVDRRNRKGLPV